MARLPVLLAAAFVQWNGAQFRRRYELAMKILIIVAPGVGGTLDDKFKGTRGDDADADQANGNWVNVLLAIRDVNLTRLSGALYEMVTDLLIAILGWFLFLTTAIWVVIGFLVETVTGLVAKVLRDGSFDIAGSTRLVFSQWQEASRVLRDAWGVQYEYTIESGSLNSDLTCDAVALPTVTGIPTFAFSAQTGGYRDGGPRLDYRLRNGRLEFRNVPRVGQSAASWLTFASENRDYSNTRAATLASNPEFDMLAASNDRVFVKRRGKAEFWFGIPAEMFPGSAADREIPAPSTYFKLDPEPTADPKGRTREISNSSHELLNYSKTHPQAERLPLFHTAISAGALPAMIVSVKPKVLYKLDTRPPRVGVGMPEVLTDGPSGLKTRPAIRYRRTEQILGITSSTISDEVPEFAFDKVLGMAVGNFHFYEPWIADYGGEIQWIASKGLFGLGYNSAVYGLFNGPIDDGDGAIDGTCNFYILVRIPRNDTNLTERFGILWCDEQTFFTKRWRLLHPRDNLPVNFAPPDDVNLSVHALVEADNQQSLIGGQYSFDRDKFLQSDPGHKGWLNENSRLAGARQALVVNGRKGSKNWLFSITYSYGCVDYCWRIRELPTRAADDFDRMRMREDLTIMIPTLATSTLPPGCWVQRYLPADRKFPADGRFRHPWRFLPEAAAQRLDRYPYFGVLAEVDQRVQYYRIELIKIDGQEIPDAARPALEAALEGVRLCDHQDQLYIRARKFKWGLLNDLPALEEWLVDDNQLPGKIASGTEIEAITEKLFASYKDPPEPELEYRKSRTSMFNDHARFRLHDRGPLGWILLWDDKRDDDLISIADLPREVVLTICPPLEPPANGGGQGLDPRTGLAVTLPIGLTGAATGAAAVAATAAAAVAAAAAGIVGTNFFRAFDTVIRPGRKVTVRILAQERLQLPPPVSTVALFEGSSPEGLLVKLTVPLSLVESLRHIWKMHIALWPPTEQQPRRVTVPGGVSLDTFAHEALSKGRTQFTLELKVANVADLALLRKGSSSTNNPADAAAATIWFEGPSGLVSTPDLISWL